jgi:acyl transferase domain-containing protein/acyl-CoA synthetase (AMP-forming)/AMP-acid ligase II/acyl carrier protein
MALPDCPSRQRYDQFPGGFPATLTALLQTRAAHQPDDVGFGFLADGETVRDRLTYAELDCRARQVAGLLRLHGACGKPVLLLYPPGLEYITAFFGCLYAGAIAVPAYPPHRNRSLDRLRSIVGDAGAHTVLCTVAVRDAIERMSAEAPDLHALDWLATDAPGVLNVEPFCDDTATPDQIAFLQYTSGSTSSPKGVMLSHGNLCHNSLLIWEGFRFDNQSSSVFWLPLYHDMGLIGGVLQPLHIGRTSHLMAPATFLASPVRWLRAISTLRATISGAPNFAYDICARIPVEQRAGLDLSHWRVAFNGAEPIRAETLERFAAAFAPYGFQPEAAYPCYGLAESTLIVTGGLHERPPVKLSVSRTALERHRAAPIDASHPDARILVGCGSPLLDQRVAIVDPESLTPCPADVPGEIWIAGPSVAQGYWQRPEDSERCFGARTTDGDGPFLRTGDLGFFHAGELYVTGRIKDLIIIRGRNLYPQDVEQTAEASHPALRNGCGAAFAIETDGEERLIYVSELERTGRTTPADEVAAAVTRAVVEALEVPVDAVVLLKPGGIPKTSSGKIQRHACRAGYLAGTLDVIATWQRPAETEVETASPNAVWAGGRTADDIRAWLVDRIARKLRMPVVDLDPQEPLARYGLDSLTAVQTAGELEQWLGRPLSPVLVYDHPTIDSLARFLAGERAIQNHQSLPTAAGGASDPIAVIGIGCHFPGADGPAAFWRLLRDGVDAITEVPADRWAVDDYYDEDGTKPGTMNTRWGGFLKAVDRFDRSFFGIAPREAERMDPQQRLLLETTWEALEDAGHDPLAVSRNGNVGVYVGISSNDYGRLQGDAATLDAYVGTGNAMSIAANRLSYAFDFRGPSLAVDTACSSSLVAIHLACQSLRRGESDMAVAAGVNLILTPDLTVNFTRAGMMAPDGRCKAFDAAANGYVRSEGCGVVVLKPLSKALADGDPVYAVVRGSAINQDGRSNGLTAPNGQSQEAVLRAAYRDAGITPAEIEVIEAHGTGTSLGDPIEALALGSVLAEGRPTDRPVLLGSVKTNVGHLEAAAGLAGFIKTALALKHGEVPASLHFHAANPHIPFEQLPLRVVTERQPWPDHGRPARAGVSSFGFGGTNCHVVLEAIIQSPIASDESNSHSRSGTKASTDAVQLIPLSARSPEALRQLAESWIDVLATADTPFNDLAFTAARRRGHHDHRVAIVARDRTDLAEKLQAWLADDPRAGTTTGRRLPNRRAKPVWVFAGQGPQWWGMGRRLLESEPVFRAAVESCDSIFIPLAGWSLAEELRTQNDPARLDDTDRVQPVLFALQVGLAALWRSWGIEPAAVIGHSLGEAAAAYVAGALTLDDAIRVMFHRSRLQHRLSGRGKMAAVGLTAEESATALRGFEGRLALAAINGPKSTVWSGDPAALDEALKPLATRDIFYRVLRGQVAFHSPQMEPLREQLTDSLSGLAPRPSTVPFYSTVTGGVLDGDELDAVYWGRNLREPVQFAAAADALIAAGFDLFLELGPHPVLTEPLHQSLRHRKTAGLVLSSLRRDEDDRAAMLAAVGGLFAAGASPSWERVVPSGSVAPLPSYPWQRERCWYEAPKVERNGYHHRNGFAPPSLNGHVHESTTEDRWLVRLAWETPANTAEITRLSGTWLAITDDERAATRLTGLLRDNGAGRVVIATSAEAFAVDGPDRYRFNPADPAQVRRLVRDAIPSPADFSGVLHMAAVSAPTADALSGEALAAAQERGVVGLLHLVQALAANGTSPRLWVVTRGAQAVVDGDAASVAQAPVWGLGRTLANEHPELRFTLIDFDPTPSAGDFPRLVSALGADTNETQLAVRDGKLHVARLLAAPTAGHGHAPTLRADATYLITGGLGGLGMQIAGWLVANGARSLVLTGRRGPTAEAESALAELRAVGANVIVARADAADFEQLADVIADIDHTLPPLRGVIHAAGVLDDGIALQQTRDRVWKVLSPKLLGGWHLHALTAGRKLDFFALFSSAAALLGSPGQSNYAAANAALDGLAAFRRARGLPAVSINWGPWAGTGMASRDGKVDRLSHAGMGSIDSGRGLELFGRLLASPAAQIGVIPADWAAFRRMAGGRLPPFLAALAGVNDEASAIDTPAVHVPSALNRAALDGVPPDDWQPILVGQLREQAARVLRLAAAALDVEQPLNNVGIDSLMAIELKNRIEADLGVTVPMVKFLEGPSVRDLAGYVAEHLIPLLAVRPAVAGLDAHAAGDLLARLDGLSDDQVDALLAEMTAAGKGD